MMPDVSALSLGAVAFLLLSVMRLMLHAAERRISATNPIVLSAWQLAELQALPRSRSRRR